MTEPSRDNFTVGNIHVYIKETHIKIYHGFINMGNAFTMVCVPHQKILLLSLHIVLGQLLQQHSQLHRNSITIYVFVSANKQCYLNYSLNSLGNAVAIRNTVAKIKLFNLYSHLSFRYIWTCTAQRMKATIFFSNILHCIWFIMSRLEAQRYSFHTKRCNTKKGQCFAYGSGSMLLENI